VGLCLVESSRKTVAQVRELAITYSSEGGDAISALDGVSIDIRAGEVVGILGESGCGKSTLARALLRLLPPNGAWTRGTILIDGRDLLHLSATELRLIRGRVISLIPQDPALALNPVLSVGSQVAEVLRAHLLLNAQQRRQRGHGVAVGSRFRTP
jgi:ABC-type glutathione transport system ATPase component